MDEGDSMSDPSDSTHPERPADGAGDASEPILPDDATSEPDGGPTEITMVEVLPGVAVVFGDEIPTALQQELIDLELLSPHDRSSLSAALAGVAGNTATMGGNLANAVSSAQGLYRLDAATYALLNRGGALAAKDGANLGAVFANGKIVAQARLIPASVTAAQTVAAIGPALALIAIQVQLNQISKLVGTNIALTGQVLTTIRNEQWAELTGLVSAIDRALDQARELGSVPESLWDTVSGHEAILRKQLDLYRLNVGTHIKQIDRLIAQRRREYLETNAEAILFDSNALLSALKAWTAFQALHASKARGFGDPDNARLIEIISRDTREEFDRALNETTRLVGSLTRELGLISELPGRATLPLSRKRSDSKVTRFTSTKLLEAIEPLANALRPLPPPLEPPTIVCGLKEVDLEPYIRVLRWILDEDETLRCIGFPYQLNEGELVRTVGRNVLGRLAPERWATFVAVTDRRIITAGANSFRQAGEIRQVIPVDQVRYVRTRAASTEGVRSTIDLVTRDEDIRWAFHPETDSADVSALAAVLAESMTIPDAERNDLLEKRTPEVAAEMAEDAQGRGRSETIPEDTE